MLQEIFNGCPNMIFCYNRMIILYSRKSPVGGLSHKPNRKEGGGGVTWRFQQQKWMSTDMYMFFLFKYSLNVTCLVVHVMSIYEVSIAVCFFSSHVTPHVQFYMVHVNWCAFLVCVEVFTCRMSNTLSKLHTRGFYFYFVGGGGGWHRASFTCPKGPKSYIGQRWWGGMCIRILWQGWRPSLVFLQDNPPGLSTVT